jgi:RHS repeat-associated protein
MLIIQERDSNNVPQVTYTRGLDLSGSLQSAGGIGGLLARTDANGSAFFHADALGNVTVLMDGNQNIVGRYMYSPFGKLIGKWGPLADANVMQFSSMPQHDGLVFYPFRVYDPIPQRWPNHDPIGERGGINLYRAMNNNPVNWIDPLGLLVVITTTQGNVISVWTAQQFINQVQAQPDGTISDINFVGHGSSEVQGISDDNTPIEGLSLQNGVPVLNGPSTGNNNVPIEDVLKGKMSPNGHINLDGCSTAAKNTRNPGQPNLPQALSGVVSGVSVTGSTKTTYGSDPEPQGGHTHYPFTINTYVNGQDVNVLPSQPPPTWYNYINK